MRISSASYNILNKLSIHIPHDIHELIESLDYRDDAVTLILAITIDNNLKLKQMADSLDQLLIDEQSEGTLLDQVVTLFTGISDKLDAAITEENGELVADPVKVQAVSDAIKANQTKMQALIDKGTKVVPAGTGAIQSGAPQGGAQQNPGAGLVGGPPSNVSNLPNNNSGTSVTEGIPSGTDKAKS